MRVAYVRTRNRAWPAAGGPPRDWDVVVFSDASEFVARARGRGFDAALVALPNDAGLLTRVLSLARAAVPDLPIVVAAAAAREAEAAAGAAEGAFDYWLDSMTPLRLRHALEQAALRRRENPPFGARQFLERILNAIADPVFVKDREHRMLFINDALCALTGRPREQMLGRDERDYLPPDQAAVFFRQDDLVFESGRENVNEEILTDARGVSHVLVTKKTVWRDADGRPYLVGVIREITDLVQAVDDRKNSEQLLRRAQKLEAVGRLAGGVAHDFNNVLTAIVNGANLALGCLPRGHAAREEVEEIRRACDQAGQLTRQLLSFSRRPEGLPQVLDLSELFVGMRKLLQRLLPAHIDLEFRVPDRLGAVRIDPGQAERVLLNLVANAGDAMPSGGRVFVELADAAQGGGGLSVPCVRLTVSDDGVGMDESTRATIFEPLFTTKPQGTGFGLSIVRDVVARSGGAVVVESAPGRGSKFSVFWPRCAEKKVRAGRRTESRARIARRACVLVVEDDETVRRFVVRCLEREGHEVLSAADGLEALRLSDANEGGFDVAVVDVILPRLLGTEFVERMRARQPKAKVLFISGQPSAPAVRDCSASARAEFLPKPFDAPLLAERVRVLLESAAK
jgi:PAS domain S-box-containing protein